jgi:hypothetical protein
MVPTTAILHRDRNAHSVPLRRHIQLTRDRDPGAMETDNAKSPNQQNDVRSTELKSALDRYSVAMQQYKAVLDLLPMELRPEPIGPFYGRQSIAAYEKQTEVLRARRARVERLRAFLDRKRLLEQPEKRKAPLAPHLRCMLEPCFPRQAAIDDHSNTRGPPDISYTPIVVNDSQSCKEYRDETQKVRYKPREHPRYSMTMVSLRNSSVWGLFADPLQAGKSYTRKPEVHAALTAPLPEGDIYLIMHLWELYPALGYEFSKAVRTCRAWGVRATDLQAGTYANRDGLNIAEDVAEILVREIGIMRSITAELEKELCV